MIPRSVIGLAIALGCACGSRDDGHGKLVLQVTDGATPIGARVVLFDAAGAPVRLGTLDLYGQRQGGAACAIAPGVIGSWGGIVLATGAGEIPVGSGACALKPGRYTVWAWHGVDYERWEGIVDVSADGPVQLAIPLTRAWAPRGALAADLHVHAHASNDSTMPDTQRVAAQVASGLQVIGLANHNSNGDLADAIRTLHLESVVTSIASSELTSEQLHVGAYPVPVTPGAPRGGALAEDTLVHASAAELFAIARAMPTHPIIQVNHPRFRYGALFDLTKWDGVAWPPPFPLDFDALEVIAGYSAFDIPGDRRIDDTVRDFYTLVDHGHLVAPLGNSDTHDFNWVLDGTARSYVMVDDPRTQPFDQAAFIAGIRARHTVATTCPWIELTVDAAHARPGDRVTAREGGVALAIDVSQAGFCHADRIRITIGTPTGPQLVETIAIPPNARTHHWAGRIAVGAADTWIGVTADGDTPLPLEQTGTYQKDKWKHPGVTPYAIVSPLLVDVDGDQRWKRGDADLP